MPKKKAAKELLITLVLTLHEAKQLCANQGGQTTTDAETHHGNYFGQRIACGSFPRVPLDHDALYNIFDRLDDAVVAAVVQTDKPRKAASSKKKPK